MCWRCLSVSLRRLELSHLQPPNSLLRYTLSFLNFLSYQPSSIPTDFQDVTLYWKNKSVYNELIVFHLTISLTSYLCQVVILHKDTQSRDMTHPTLCTKDLMEKENKVTAKLKWYGSSVMYLPGTWGISCKCTMYLCLLWWLEKGAGLSWMLSCLSFVHLALCTFNSASIYDNRYLYKFCMHTTLPYFYINRNARLYSGLNASSAFLFRTLYHVPKQSRTKVLRSIHN